MEFWASVLCVLTFYLFFYGLTADDIASFNQLQKKDQGCKNSKNPCGEQKTCCLSETGAPRCCQYANAVCCEDMLHCCPKGTTCDVKNKRCIDQSKEPMEWPIEDNVFQAIKIVPKYSVERTPLTEFYDNIRLKVTCPDQTVCPGTETCCMTLNGSYGCCLFTLGVCCPDKQTCCPFGQRCHAGSCY